MFSAGVVSHKSKHVEDLLMMGWPARSITLMQFWQVPSWMHTSLPKQLGMVAPLRDPLEKRLDGGQRAR